MGDELPIVIPQKTLKDRIIDWLFQQGIAIIVLIGVVVAMGWYTLERDKAQIAALAEKDKLNAEYREKAEVRQAEIRKIEREAAALQMAQLERLLTTRINDVKQRTETTEKRVDSLMP